MLRLIISINFTNIARILSWRPYADLTRLIHNICEAYAYLDKTGNHDTTV